MADRLGHRVGHRTMMLVPLAGAPVQSRYQIALLLHQMRGENLGKEMVVAIPVALVIQRNYKEVASL